MAATVTPIGVPLHLVFFQGPRPKMAKADLNFLQDRRQKAEWGAVLARVPSLLNLTDSQMAARLDVPASQLSAWHSGAENAAMWRYYADPDVFLALQWAQDEAKGYIRPATIERPALKVG